MSHNFDGSDYCNRCGTHKKDAHELDCHLKHEEATERIEELEEVLDAETGLRLAMERQAFGIEDAARARINDAKAILVEALTQHGVKATPKGIIRLARQVASLVAGWSRVIGRRDLALKELGQRAKAAEARIPELLAEVRRLNDDVALLEEEGEYRKGYDTGWADGNQEAADGECRRPLRGLPARVFQSRHRRQGAGR